MEPVLLEYAVINQILTENIKCLDKCYDGEVVKEGFGFSQEHWDSLIVEVTKIELKSKAIIVVF